MLKPMFPNQTSFLVASLFALAIAEFTSSIAFAANCEDVTIVLINNDVAGKEIKATKFEYKDGFKWKTENIFGLDGHQRIGVHKAIDFKRNLQGIGSESTQFRVTYRLANWLLEGSRWGDDIVETTDTFTCLDNGYYHVWLPEPLSPY